MACASALLMGCAHAPTINYPLLPVPGATEQGLDCAALSDQLDKADAIRWSIRQSGVSLPAGHAQELNVAAYYALEAATVITLTPIWLGADPAKAPVYALARADTRIQKLLVLKRDKSCPLATTGAPGLSDRDLLDRLEKLDQSYASKAIKEKALLTDRTELLDSLRDPASLHPPTVPMPTVTGTTTATT